MSISDWPELERPREKLIKLGASTLSDAELLAIFLRTGYAGKTAVDLARELLTQFKGLRSLLEASHKSFCSVKGLGDAKFSQLHATLEMARRHLSETIASGPLLNASSDVKNFLKSELRHRQQEVFLMLYLNSQHALIAQEELFIGTINHAHIHPREVLKQVMHHNAAAILIAHNHPSGQSNPSQADLDITERLAQALMMIDVKVLDHLIVGEGEVFSFAEQGLMPTCF